MCYKDSLFKLTYKNFHLELFNDNSNVHFSFSELLINHNNNCKCYCLTVFESNGSTAASKDSLSTAYFPTVRVEEVPFLSLKPK